MHKPLLRGSPPKGHKKGKLISKSYESSSILARRGQTESFVKFFDDLILFPLWDYEPYIPI